MVTARRSSFSAAFVNQRTAASMSFSTPSRCGALRSNRTAADDSPVKLLSIALKPLALPPFPIERMEELSSLLGGGG